LNLFTENPALQRKPKVTDARAASSRAVPPRQDTIDLAIPAIWIAPSRRSPSTTLPSPGTSEPLTLSTTERSAAVLSIPGNLAETLGEPTVRSKSSGL
jgi:hypothetical protein